MPQRMIQHAKSLQAKRADLHNPFCFPRCRRPKAVNTIPHTRTPRAIETDKIPTKASARKLRIHILPALCFIGERNTKERKRKPKQSPSGNMDQSRTLSQTLTRVNCRVPYGLG